jgi:hypothetical protein
MLTVNIPEEYAELSVGSTIIRPTHYWNKQLKVLTPVLNKSLGSCYCRNPVGCNYGLGVHKYRLTVLEAVIVDDTHNVNEIIIKDKVIVEKEDDTESGKIRRCANYKISDLVNMLNEIKDGKGDLHILYTEEYYGYFVKFNNHRDVCKIVDHKYLYFGNFLNNCSESYYFNDDRYADRNHIETEIKNIKNCANYKISDLVSMLNEIKDENGDLHILYHNSDDYVKLNEHKDIVKIVDTYLYFGDIYTNSECYTFEKVDIITA